jgi:hypothetical protein
MNLKKAAVANALKSASTTIPVVRCLHKFSKVRALLDFLHKLTMQ